MKRIKIEIAQHWRTNAIQSRQILYRHLRKLVKDEFVEWNDIYKAAVGSAERGTDYESNFRSGKISRKKAAKILIWLRSAYPDRATNLENELEESMPKISGRKSFPENLPRPPMRKPKRIQHEVE